MVGVILFLEEPLVCMISFFSSTIRDLHVCPEPEGTKPWLRHILQLSLLLSEWVVEPDTQERILGGKPAPAESWSAAAAWQNLFSLPKSFWAILVTVSLKGKYRGHPPEQSSSAVHAHPRTRAHPQSMGPETWERL